jgi:hypothetical protein
MKRPDPSQDPRRRLLIQALTSGLLSTAMPGANALADSIFGTKPAKLTGNQSIYRITGQTMVNGKNATLQTRIAPGDTITTGKDSELIFVIGGHAMLLRDRSQLVIEAAKQSATTLLITALRLLNGKLLSVSRDTPLRLETSTGSIGIRGTGFYVESSPEQTYFCTCYGVTDVTAIADPSSRVTVTSQHHDRPLTILKNAERGQHIVDAPFINHTDQELTLIETLVGRTTPFVFSNDTYRAPRRDY